VSLFFMRTVNSPPRGLTPSMWPFEAYCFLVVWEIRGASLVDGLVYMSVYSVSDVVGSMSLKTAHSSD